MNREIKFRAYNQVSKKMYLEAKVGDVFKWQNEGQVQSIMQFTGLKDKNGIDIYEGDVVNINAPSWDNSEYKSEIVSWDDENLGFWPWTDVSAQIDLDRLASTKSRDIEVIGNIYETPELIKS